MIELKIAPLLGVCTYFAGVAQYNVARQLLYTKNIHNN